MPQVPLYDGNQVREAPLQGGIQDANQYLGGARNLQALGQGLDQAGQGLDRIVHMGAQTAANAADKNIAGAWLKWDAENRRKYQGENVDQYGAEAEKWWRDAAQTYAGTLNPLSKSLVNKTLVRRQEMSLGSVAQYIGQEKERHADDVASAALDTTIQFGVTTGDMAGATNRVRELVSEMGARKGWTTEQVQKGTLAALSSAHLAQISKLAQANPDAAQKYYQDHKDEVSFTQQPRVEEILKGESDNQAATQFAASVSPLPLSEQLKKASDITDPQRREKTLLQIRNNHSMVEAAQHESEQAASDSAWQLVGQGKRVPEEVLSRMDGRERVQLQDHLRAVAERGPVPPKTDPKDHARLIDMMLNDPEAFKRERIAAAKLSPNDMEQFAAKQQAMRTSSPKQDSMLTDEQRMSDAIVRSGIDPKKHPDQAYAVRTEIDRRVRADSSSKGGKDLSPDEKQRIVDDVIMDRVFVPEWGTDPQKPIALLKPEELAKSYVTVNGKDIPLSTVPMEDRAHIIRGRRKRGLPVTEQAIVETFLKGQQASKKPEGTW